MRISRETISHALAGQARSAAQKALYFKRSMSLNRKVRNIYRLNEPEYDRSVGKKIVVAHRQKWSRLKKNVNVRWLKIFTAISGQTSVDYVPEDIFFLIIEPRLNNADFLLAYKDKNFYEMYYEPKIFPKALLRNIDGVFYDGNYGVLKKDQLGKDLYELLEPERKVIVKPATGTSGGSNVRLFVKEGNRYVGETGTVLSLPYLVENYKTNFVIQKYLEQHPYFRKFNRASVNTVRILTYRSVATENIHVLQAVQRLGREGSLVDNQASGGLSCGINAKGELRPFAVDKFGAVYQKSEEGILFSEAGKVVKFEEMKALAAEVARKTYYARLLGFDFCVDEKSDIKLIEINNKYLEINFLQMNNGPLFGDFTDEIIRYCENPGRKGRGGK
jgi:hypothetical protein